MRITKGIRSRLLGVGNDERGIGLPEFIVAIFLVGILSTLVVVFYTSVSRTFTKERAATDSTMVAAIGMKELTRVIRSGTEIPVSGEPLNEPVFVSADSEAVVLHAFLDTESASPQPILVRFDIGPSTQVLTESRWSAIPAGGYWSFPDSTTADPATSRPVARKIVKPVGGDATLFTYLNAEGGVIASPVSSGKLRDIAAVTVTLKVQADETERATPVKLQNTVGIPNLGISRIGPSIP